MTSPGSTSCGERERDRKYRPGSVGWRMLTCPKASSTFSWASMRLASAISWRISSIRFGTRGFLNWESAGAAAKRKRSSLPSIPAGIGGRIGPATLPTRTTLASGGGSHQIARKLRLIVENMVMNPVVAVVAPGMMGAAVGGRLAAHGLKVLTSLTGRSDETIKRAKAAG